MKNVLYLLILLIGFVSCKEQDDTVEEFPNWAAQNDAYFSQLVDQARAKAAAGDKSWEVIQSYNVPATNHANQYYDNIVVEKLEWSTDADEPSPLQTDTVRIHYVGRLKTSAVQYATEGMVFDRSYTGTFDPVVCTPSKMSVGSTVYGFATALMHMKRGDHWRVYIPYQLGYGTAVRGSIPAGSTLIFDLRLVDFWRRK